MLRGGGPNDHLTELGCEDCSVAEIAVFLKRVTPPLPTEPDRIPCATASRSTRHSAEADATPAMSPEAH